MLLKVFLSILFLFIPESIKSWDSVSALKYFNDQIKSFDDPVDSSEPLPGIDKLYVVNLAFRGEKLDYVLNHAASFGLAPIRFDAIYGLSLDPEFLKFYKSFHDRPNFWGRGPGQIGVLLSHLSIMKHMLDNNYDVIWVWEDDIMIKDLNTALKALEELNSFDPEWDLLFTDIAPINENYYKPYFFRDIAYDLISKNYFPKADVIRACTPDKQVSPKVMQINSRLGFYSVIISQRGAKKIYEHFSNNFMKFALDVDYNFLGLNMYRTKKICVTHLLKAFSSDTTEQP